MLQPCLDVIHSQLKIYSTGFFIGISFSVVLRVSIYMYQIQWYCPASYLYVWRFVFTICYSYQLQGKKISILNNWIIEVIRVIKGCYLLFCFMYYLFVYYRTCFLWETFKLSTHNANNIIQSWSNPSPISIFLFHQTFSIVALEFISSISCVNGSIVAHIKSIKV